MVRRWGESTGARQLLCCVQGHYEHHCFSVSSRWTNHQRGGGKLQKPLIRCKGLNVKHLLPVNPNHRGCGSTRRGEWAVQPVLCHICTPAVKCTPVNFYVESVPWYEYGDDAGDTTLVKVKHFSAGLNNKTPHRPSGAETKPKQRRNQERGHIFRESIF